MPKKCQKIYVDKHDLGGGYNLYEYDERRK